MKKPLYLKAKEPRSPFFILLPIFAVALACLMFYWNNRQRPETVSKNQTNETEITSSKAETDPVPPNPILDIPQGSATSVDVRSEPPKTEVIEKPALPLPLAPAHQNYSVEVEDIQTTKHPTKAGANNVTIRCKFVDKSKSESILAMKSKAHVVAAGTDAGALIAFPPPLGGIKPGLSKYHSGDFLIELTVPDTATKIEYVDFKVGLLWKKSESSVRWINPEKSIGQTQSQSGFSFTLIEYARNNDQLSVAYKHTVPKGAATEPHLWALDFIESKMVLGNGTKQRTSGLRDMEIRREVFKLNEADNPTAYEIRFVDQIDIEEYPVRLSNLSLPKADEGRNFNISANNKTISQGVTFLLQTMETVSTQKGHELSVKLAITLPMERQFVAASWGILEPTAMDNTGFKLQSLGDESNSTSSVDQLTRPAKIRFTLPATDATKLSSLGGKYKVFTSEVTDTIKVAVPAKNEHKILNEVHGPLKIVSIARQDDRLIVESIVETSGLANVTWAPATMKAVLLDILGNSRSPRQGGYKIDPDTKKKYLKTDIFRLDNFEPTHFSLTTVKSGKEELIPFEFKDIELPSTNKDAKQVLKF